MSVRASLTRIEHDYQGHRIRAMHAITMAIRQLSHRSMMNGGMGMNSGMGMNGGMGMKWRGAARQGGGAGGFGMRQGGGAGGLGMRQGNGAGGLQPQRMSQAQSDNRMGQDLRDCRGLTCRSQAKVPILTAIPGRADMSSKRYTS